MTLCSELILLSCIALSGVLCCVVLCCVVLCCVVLCCCRIRTLLFYTARRFIIMWRLIFSDAVGPIVQLLASNIGLYRPNGVQILVFSCKVGLRIDFIIFLLSCSIDVVFLCPFSSYNCERSIIEGVNVSRRDLSVSPRLITRESRSRYRSHTLMNDLWSRNRAANSPRHHTERTNHRSSTSSA